MIGIVSAMREEIDTLIKHLENKESYSKGRRHYHTGTLFTKEVVLAFSRWGKVASATTFTQLLNDYDLDEIVFTGVAGSVKSNINIGDIVIGEKLFQHDMNASPMYERFEIPLLDKTYFETTKTKRAQLMKAATAFINDFYATISKKEATNFNILNPKIIEGDIASGDQFISKKSQLNFINSNLQSAVCVEMEGAAVAQVCYEYQIPFSIIRVISDNANDNAPIDFQQFVSQIASQYALKIFENYFK